jgi:hypothetical protein
MKYWENKKGRLIQGYFDLFFTNYFLCYFLQKKCRICNYLRIKRLFGLHGNWVTRWQPFLFQSSLLFYTNVITLCNKGITFLWIGKKVVKISLYRCDYLNLVYHQSAILWVSQFRQSPISVARLQRKYRLLLKVERSSGKPFRAESSSFWEYSPRKPFPFQACT